jgi:hypothetical protein
MLVQAPGPGVAAKLAAELQMVGVQEALLSPSPLRAPGQREWIVSLTTPALPLTAAVLRTWEDEMLALERRWPGCRFLGFKTCPAPGTPGGLRDSAPDEHVRAQARRSQRELVLASLLRRRPAGRRGIVHGRGVPR